MGLRCSLLGHAFGEPVTERERETRGAEVLITVREVRRCSRCDTEQVITENKEIRHLGSEDAESSAASPAGEQPRGATSGTASAGAEETPDSEPGETADGSAEPAPEPGAGAADTTETEAEPEPESAEIVSESADAEADDDVDVSDLVDAAEEPDAGGPGRSPPVGDTEGPEEESLPDEDVEIIDAGTEEEPPGTAADRAEDTEEEIDPAPADAGQKPETGDEVGETASGGTPADESEAAVESTEAQSETPDPSETDAEPEPDDAGPPDDDAVILDNDAGKDARESDVGRRELAGSGNMFDASAPENQEARESASDPSRPDDAGDETETWPGREVEGRVEEPSGDEPGSSDPTEWPASEPIEDDGESSDSAFQFDQDRLDEETDTGGKTPSGLTSEGPVDVAGDPGESPPTSVECPECGYTADGVGSSLRAGDICPECHEAYLADRR